MTKKPLKKCSIFLVIGEMQIKTTLRFHLTFIRMAKTNKTSGRQLMLEMMWSKGNTHPLLVGVQIYIAIMEISVVVYQENRN